MTDLDSLAAALHPLTGTPADTTLRLAYADELDACGDPVGAALQRVLAEPHVNAWRLAYADARSDLRYAEFIRVQVELAKFPQLKIGDTSPEFGMGLLEHIMEKAGEPDTARLSQLRRRERELIGENNAHAGNWINRKPFPSWSGPSGYGWVDDGDYLSVIAATFRRGFVDEVRCSSAAWFAHGDAILELHPITRVVLEDVPVFKLDFNTGRMPHSVSAEVAGMSVMVYSEVDLVRDRQAGTLFQPELLFGTRLTPATLARVLSRRWPRVPDGGWVLPG